MCSCTICTSASSHRQRCYHHRWHCVPELHGSFTAFQLVLHTGYCWLCYLPAVVHDYSVRNRWLWYILGTGANPVGGITLPLRSVVVQSNSMTPNMWMGLADTGVSPAISTVAIKTCYTTVATSQFAQTVVCTSSSTGLYLPVCPTTVPTFATSGTTVVSTTGTCYNSECQLVCVLMRHMTCFVPLC